MSRCYNCSQNFGFFKKPVTCGNCNFAFCSGCCSEKVNVPKRENKLLVVCSKCKAAIKNGANQTSESEKDLSLPKNFLKLVEANKNKQVTSVSASAKTENATDETQQLVNKLENLKKLDKTKPAIIPTEQELENRLQKLKYGDNPPPEKPQWSNTLVEDKIKSPDDLIKQLHDEAKLDKKYEEYEKGEMDKLENRLKKLEETEAKKEPEPAASSSSASAQAAVSENETDDEKTNKLVEQLLKEIKVDDEEDKDPWCCMCNADADLKCIDCENDFYCNKCFKKIHVISEYKAHRKETIKK